MHEVYGERILAIGVYGSVARGTDGPFSDMEMVCVLKESGPSVDDCYEWTPGPWKAEVDVRSSDVLLKKASTVDGRWPLTHGPFFCQLRLYDPDHFFAAVKEAAESPTREDFRRAIRELLVGDMYELAGKLRNADRIGPHSYLPVLAVEFAWHGAMLIGLHNRKLYTTRALVLPEALELPDRPAGFDRVAKLVMSGQLAEPAAVVSACEELWGGLVDWAAERDYVIHTVRIPF